LNPTLTIVLPVHNGESRLRVCVGEILELASELTQDFQVLIVDDGSTDDTFAAAEELSTRYPQISVRRHSQRRGLGQTLELIRRRVRSDVVIVHDGTSTIDPEQVRILWGEHIRHESAGRGRRDLPHGVDPGTLKDVAVTHRALAKAHGRLLGFQLITPEPAANGDAVSVPNNSPRTDVAHSGRQRGMGQIPPLPRPNFLRALADFALDE
jgi:glycosyltransferase involved in cell wall biosynthesis